MRYDFKGLNNEEVVSSRGQHGSNKLTPQEVEGFWAKLIGNFKDPIIGILIVALVIQVVLAVFGYSHWYESIGIATAVILAAMVATMSEYKNETSFQKLQEEASKTINKVFRGGQITETMIDEIVVGDYVLLQPGDKIPADGKLVVGSAKVNQAALTGEPDDITKTKAPTDFVHQKNDLMDKHMVFRGSVISDGEAVMLVETVGDKTFYGNLAQEMGGEDRESPLQIKLSALADGISRFGYIGSVCIALAFMFKKIVMDHNFMLSEMIKYFNNWQIVLNDVVTAVILAVIVIVMAVPEGLPMMIAIVLSINMRKLLGDNVLVRRLIGIETAGSLNILFSDKTGTITRGQLEAVTFVTGDNKSFAASKDLPEKLRSLLTLAIRQNTACVINETCDIESNKIVGGNPTERALLKFIDLDEPLRCTPVKIIGFNSTRKFSASQVTGEVNTILIKGAPEIILEKCKTYYSQDGQKQLFNSNADLVKELDNLANRAIRVVAIATGDGDIIDETIPDNLTLIGVVGIRDELRPESVTAITDCQNAGIQVVMITGDRKETAVAIAREAGLITGSSDIVLTSSELQSMTNEDLKKSIPNLRVVARALPTDKSRFVSVAQDMGLVVGMTGDGVNDAPALKKADVGFAMGSGTEVAKEAGDIVILDDNINSISKAVLYGRTIFNSIRKFVVFQLTINVSAVMVAFLGPLLGFEMPLTIIQMLWVNLVMDTLAALALGGEPALAKYMLEPPKRRDESIITRNMWSAILANGILVACLSVIFLKGGFVREMFHSELAFMTGFFGFFIFTGMFNAFNARTDGINLFSHMTENKGFLRIIFLIFVVQIAFSYVGGNILRTTGLALQEWSIAFAFAILIIPYDMIRKATLTTKPASESAAPVALNTSRAEQAATKNK